MKRIHIAQAAVLIAHLVIGLSTAHAWLGQEVDIGSASGGILIVSPTPVVEPIKARRIVSIKVLQVRNFRGNNPLNQQQPVNNLDGTTFETLAETLDSLLGRTVVTTTEEEATTQEDAACIGTFTMMQSGGAPATHRFASLEVDPNTGQCIKVHEDGSTGSTLIVQTPPDNDPGFQGVAFPDVLVGIWTIINPPPDDASGNGIRLLNDTFKTITIQSTAGVQVQVTLKIINQGGNEYNLQITEFKRL